MGASEFTNVGRGKNAQEAFNALKDYAGWESGHGGYSGTIAEKHNFKIIDKVETQEEAFAKVDQLFAEDDQRLDKWGPACCIEYKDKTGKASWVFFGLASS